LKAARCWGQGNMKLDKIAKRGHSQFLTHFQKRDGGIPSFPSCCWIVQKTCYTLSDPVMVSSSAMKKSESGIYDCSQKVIVQESTKYAFISQKKNYLVLIVT